MALAAATAAAEEEAGDEADAEAGDDAPYMPWSPRFTPARIASSLPDSTFQKNSSPA